MMPLLLLGIALLGAYSLGRDPAAQLRSGAILADVPGQTVVMQIGRSYRTVMSFASRAGAELALSKFDRPLSYSSIRQQGTRFLLTFDMKIERDVEKVPIGATVRFTPSGASSSSRDVILGTVQSVQSLDGQPLEFFTPSLSA